MPTVIVYWSAGRSPEQKQRVSQRIHDALVEDGGARPEDVLIIYQNIEAGDSARPGAAPVFTHNHHANTEESHGS
jgi:phenylpyruvate tautomerase PptA (4-oxalocrotonate tautomerase family)